MTERDVADPQRVELLAALLDHDDPPWPPGELPPLAHWLCFPPKVRQSALGEDGHPRRDDPDGLTRRMWAGSRVRFLAPVPLGATLERRTVETSSVLKSGRSGPMRFVTLAHSIRSNGAPAIEEEQDIVYRATHDPDAIAAPPPPAAESHVGTPEITRVVTLNATALFRFSALTFNAHRIHYDRDYARDREGYPGLVVHGPLIATLLIDHHLRSRPAKPLQAFGFRALRPLFDGAPFTLGLNARGDETDLVALAPDGGVAMRATART
jgi:3-methylfumaryl-CoA hydratase